MTKWNTGCIRRLLAAVSTVAALFFWTSPVYASEDPSLNFDIALDGDLLAGYNYYSGPVDVNVTLPRADESLSLWIDDAGVWKLILPPESGKTYTLTFSDNSSYRLRFRVEDADTRNTFIKDIDFAINAPLADAVSRIDALPDANAEDRVILNKKAEVIALQNLINGLREDVRKELSSSQLYRVDSLCSRLNTLDPDTDYFPPYAPEVSISGQYQLFDSYYYSSDPLDLTVYGAKDGDSVLVNTGDGWNDLKPDANGKYKHTLMDPGLYRIDFCLEDSSGNRSKSVCYDLVVDPDIPILVNEIDRLYRGAQTSSQDEYVSSLETLYLQYLDFSPLRQSLVPAKSSELLKSMYTSIIDAIHYQSEVSDNSGRFIRAVGMYQALDIPVVYLGASDVVFHAQRTETPSPPADVPGEVLAEYRFSFACEDMENDNLAIRPKHPVRICIQLPEDLIGKRNVDMLHVDENGKVSAAGVKVRSTEENLVLYFNLEKPGRYLFVSGVSD